MSQFASFSLSSNATIPKDDQQIVYMLQIQDFPYSGVDPECDQFFAWKLEDTGPRSPVGIACSP